MTPRKLNVFFANFAYSGNGGGASEHPDIRTWFAQTLLYCKSDNRIGEIVTETLSDTPITMTRNAAILKAREAGCDVLVFCDSDQSPIKHASEPDFKPFFQSSFDYLYKHYDKGPVAIGCPYCGPPPGENVYVFHWDNTGFYGDETTFSLEQYSRAEAAKMRGIQECAALPTGLIMYDMRCFELTEPYQMTRGEVIDAVLSGKMDRNQAVRALSDGWFYYEWKNGFAAEKASTEDVTQTRDLSMAGIMTLGYNPVLCNWDSPIGHWKPWCVPGRPQMMGVEGVGSAIMRAISNGHRSDMRMTDVSQIVVPHDAPLLSLPKQNGHKQNGVKKSEIWDGSPQIHLDGLTALAQEMTIRLGRQPKAVEIGSWHGKSAKALVKGGAKVLCVDTWEGSPDGTDEMAKKHDVYMTFLQNTVEEREAGLIEPWQSDSEKAASIIGKCDGWPSGPFDIIFIDAEHTYEACKADILAWLPHLSPDGVMILHDFKVQCFPGVTKAIHEIFGLHAAPYCWSESCGGFALISARDIRHLLPEPAGVC